MSHKKMHEAAADAVVFDLDGTLIDSVPIYYNIIDIIFDRLGIPPVPRSTLLEAMQNGDFEWNLVLPDELKNQKDQLVAEARVIIDEIAPPMFQDQIRLIPGTAGTLKESHICYVLTVAGARYSSLFVIFFKHNIGNYIGRGSKSQAFSQLLRIVWLPACSHHDGTNTVLAAVSVLLDKGLKNTGPTGDFLHCCPFKYLYFFSIFIIW